MILVRHRVNTITELKDTKNSYGVEIDVRSGPFGLYLSHDPLSRGDLLSEWIKSYSHSLLVVNVKEDGLENEIVDLLRKHEVSNYFFLDQALPTLVRRGLMGLTDSSLRLSEYESMESLMKLREFSKWVWVDFLHKPEMSQVNLESLKNMNLKICLVSPELHSIDRLKEVDDFQNQLLDIHPLIDAVCTKFPERWELN
jgi:hypothetical protein